MSDLTTFSFDTFELNVIEYNNKPYFKAKEICDILGYKNNRQALSDNVKDKYKIKLGDFEGSHFHGLPGFQPATILISEPGLYSLIMKSNLKLKIVEDFQDWVLEIVLPSIREKGYYKLNETIQQLEQDKQLLQTNISTLKKQRTVQPKTEHDISLTSRLLMLHYLTYDQVNSISKKETLEINGKLIDIVNPDYRSKYIPKLIRLSKLLSNKHREVFDKNPNICSSLRTNIYSYQFFLNFGDEVIRQYFSTRPLDTWGIDWVWSTGNNEDDNVV